MRLKSITLIFLYILFSSTLVFAQSNESEIVIYRDKNFPYSVWHPKSWVNSPISNPYTRFKIISMNGEGNADFNINIVPSDNPKATAQGYVNYMLKHPEYVDKLIDKSVPGAKIIDRGKTYLSNHEAFYILSEGLYRYLSTQYHMKIYQISTYIDEYSYTLTFRCPVNEFDSYIDTFNYMARSFVVVPNPY